ncbi:hypothetical protein HSR122_0314 [Halapricum desulfuricans]|uniref:Uncharacterized protein n=1 Tax=Halapricum desulfuricans TaxID=2841257 RepID=A0A897N8Y4_9EURY|nr:hypothetical protein HSR122_0314 [Halapricum desulfuricans]
MSYDSQNRRNQQVIISYWRLHGFYRRRVTRLPIEAAAVRQLA